MYFQGKNWDFSILNAACADRYAAACQALRASAQPKDGETGGDAVRRLSAAAAAFYDAVLGPGAGDALRAGEPDLRRCLPEVSALMQAVQRDAAAARALLPEAEA